MLANLKIGGKPRQVLMQAPKNGFFYVIDRTTGKLISAESLVPVAKDDGDPAKPISWAYGVSAVTGRPLENPRARYITGKVAVRPGSAGVHNWQPMAYSPITGLVYIPIQDVPGSYESDPKFLYRKTLRNTGVRGTPVLDPDFGVVPMPRPQGFLIAWDPVAQKEVWRVPQPSIMNGGTMATAGGLVFQGGMDGKFTAYDAKTGMVLWNHDLIGVAYSGPMTYEIGGKQYVAVLSGFGGSMYLGGGFATVVPGMPINSRLNVFTLDGKAALPRISRPVTPASPPSRINVSAAVVAEGAQLYADHCQNCHGVGVWSTTVLPELRLSPNVRDQESFAQIVNGALLSQGMPDFSRFISPGEREAIRAYINSRVRYLHSAEQKRMRH
jgi:quinohemoprotein ethanol dehydrogenase